MKALIALEDGTIFEGRSFTGAGEAIGEIVFNTSMSGYQEILTDPSYTAQIVTMTYPLIGNYGVNPEDMESSRVHPRAFLVKEYNAIPSNFRSQQSLASFLQSYNVLGVEGFDTRALVRHIRTAGAMKGIVSTQSSDPDQLISRARQWRGLVGRDISSSIFWPLSIMRLSASYCACRSRSPYHMPATTTAAMNPQNENTANPAPRPSISCPSFLPDHTPRDAITIVLDAPAVIFLAGSGVRLNEADVPQRGLELPPALLQCARVTD